jgi:hypothetical protein
MDRASCGENVVILVSGVLVLELWLHREEDIGDVPTAVARDITEGLLLFPQLGFWQSFAGRLVGIRVRFSLSNIFC